MKNKNNSRFQKFSGTYKCGCCGKMTRETGDGESGCQLCAACYECGGAFNGHTDNHDAAAAAELPWLAEDMARCPWCKDSNLPSCFHRRIA